MLNVVEEIVLKCDRTALARSADVLGCVSPLNLGVERGGKGSQVLGVRLTDRGCCSSEREQFSFTNLRALLF